MKKIISLLGAIIILMAAVAGCTDYSDPKNVFVDGREYVSGFYERLYLVGVEFKEFSTSLFVEGNHHWWHLEDSLFDMYYCRHKDSLNWFPRLYCLKEQFDEVKSYYANTDNFDYYFGLYLQSDSEVLLGDDIDRALVEQAVDMIVNVDSYSTKKYKKTTLQLDGEQYVRPTIYRRSKDGLFTTTKTEWIFYQDNLYVLNRATPAGYTLFVVEEQLNQYIRSLLIQYQIV